LNNRGQFSIIAALLVAVILISTVIVTYSTIRNSPIPDQPQVLSAIDETNFAIKQILGFTIGYYGSVLKVTGNSSYAKMLALNYLYSGFKNIANMHPEWGTSFTVNESKTELHTYWFTKTSYSTGNLAVTYNLTGLGIYRITYQASCKLSIQIIKTNSTTQACLNVTKDENEPLINLGKQNFKFYCYKSAKSTWELISPSTDPIAFANGTYLIDIPSEVDSYAYVIQVEDSRGIIVSASSFSRYTCTLEWNSTLYAATDATIVVELLQNGTMRWLGQNLQLTTQAKPIPPIPVKAIHVNQTVNGLNREVPFQIEDWASDYKIPLGLTSNASVFSSTTMLVFLVNPSVSKVTIWWNGSDTTTQTPYAYLNRYFKNDDPQNGILSNSKLTLQLKRLSEEYLYVDGFNSTSTQWTTVGSSPYLNNDTSSYIYDATNYHKEGWFSFQDPTYSGISSASIEFECQCSGNEYFDFEINDGINTYTYSITSLPSSYDWKTRDLSSIINTWEKVADAKIRITFRYNSGTSSTVYIRRARLHVTYDTTAWGIKSILGNTTVTSEFFRINGRRPTYGSEPAYAIHHGVIRDIVHAEAEWSGGISGCPNMYSHIVITLPANATYYTYSLRAMFVNSLQDRSITDFSPIQSRITCTKSAWSGGWGQTLAENGTTGGLPNIASISNGVARLYNFSGSQTRWMHHFAEFLKNGKGGGIMFTNASNLLLYAFDKIAGNKAGALKVTDSLRGDGQCVTFEFSPVSAYSVSFKNALDLMWHGAVVNFDNTNPVYKEEGGNKTGLWVTVEYPPIITVTTQS
jgi:hypothetical protein